MPGMLPTNEIVARITGMNKKLLSDSRDGTANTLDEETRLGLSSPNPLDEIRAPREQPHEVRMRAYEEKKQMMMRGDRADYQYDLPKSVDSQDEKTPQHKMAKKKANNMFGVKDIDSEAQSIANKTEARNSMSKFYKEYIGSVEEFRHFAGLPLNEGQTGEVPTSGVSKDNKMKGGLPGLEGQALQDIEPDTGPEGEDHVGDAKEVTLDQALAMLKKENIDTDALWVEFLEQRGLTPELFSQLMDEAMEGEDADEIDQLLAVEGIFLAELPKLLPEGLGDLFRRKQPADPLAPVRAAGEKMRQSGVATVRAANARGVDVPKVAPVRRADSGGYQQDFSQGNRTTRSRSVTRQMPIMKAENQWEMECDHDAASGGPKMPWESSLAGLAEKYLPEAKNWIAKATKNKGALHKKLGIPMGKKIPGKKLAKAAKAGGKLGKEANLAKTLKKLHK